MDLIDMETCSTLTLLFYMQHGAGKIEQREDQPRIRVQVLMFDFRCRNSISIGI